MNIKIDPHCHLSFVIDLFKKKEVKGMNETTSAVSPLISETLMNTTAGALASLSSMNFATLWHKFVAAFEDEPGNSQLLLGPIPYLLTLFWGVALMFFFEMLDRHAPQWLALRYKLMYSGERPQHPLVEYIEKGIGAFLAQSFSWFIGYYWYSHFVTVTPTLPSFPSFCINILVMHLATDFYFYWEHRSMHSNRYLWKWVHSIHHDVIEPSALTTLYLHPVEMMTLNTGSFFVVALVRPDLFTFYFYSLLQVWVGVNSHSGWDLFSELWALVPFLAPASFHDAHHYQSRYRGNAKNLGISFVIWDAMFGTTGRKMKLKNRDLNEVKLVKKNIQKNELQRKAS